MLAEVGEEGQARIKKSSILVVGLGGLGAPVSLYLTAAGVGRIGLADNDIVSLSNLQRQILYTESDLGFQKVSCAHKQLSARSSLTEIKEWTDGLTAQNAEEIISNYDVVIDCTDNFAARRLIEAACRNLEKPWIYGAIDGFQGQVTVFNCRRKKQYHDLFPDSIDLLDTGLPIGTFGAVPGIVGSIQACEALKLVGGFGEVLDGKLLVLNTLNLTLEIIEF